MKPWFTYLLIGVLFLSLLNITSTAQTGTETDPFAATLGSNNYTIESDATIYVEFSPANATQEYILSLIGPQNSDIDITIYSGQETNVVASANSGSYPDMTTFQGYDNYMFEVYSLYGGGEISIELSEYDAKHASTATAKPAELGINTGELQVPNEAMYFNFTGLNGSYYKFETSSTDGYSDPEITLLDGTGTEYSQTYENIIFSYIPSPTIYVAVENSEPTSFTLNISLIEGVNHGSEDRARTLNSNDSLTDEFVDERLPYYLKFNTTENTTHLLNFTIAETINWVDIHLYRYYNNNPDDFIQWGDWDHISSGGGIVSVSGQEGTIYVELQPSDRGNFSVTLTQFNGTLHDNVETAKEAQLGSNTGDLVYTDRFFFTFQASSQDQWYLFSFNSIRDTDYTIYMNLRGETTTTSNWIDEGYTRSGSMRLAGGGYDIYIIEIASYDRSSINFTLDITEIEEPPRIAGMNFAEDLRAGDEFSWSSHVSENGQPRPEYDDTVGLTVREDSPSITINEGDEYYSDISQQYQELFDYSGQTTFGRTLMQQLLIPLTINLSNGETLNTVDLLVSGDIPITQGLGVEQILPRGDFGYIGDTYSSNMEGDELVLSVSGSSSYENTTLEMRYHTSIGHLLSYELEIQNFEYDQSFQISLSFNGYTEAPTTSTPEPELTLPVSPLPIVITIVAIPLLKRRLT